MRQRRSIRHQQLAERPRVLEVIVSQLNLGYLLIHREPLADSVEILVIKLVLREVDFIDHAVLLKTRQNIVKSTLLDQVRHL